MKLLSFTIFCLILCYFNGKNVDDILKANQCRTEKNGKCGKFDGKMHFCKTNRYCDCSNNCYKPYKDFLNKIHFKEFCASDQYSWTGAQSKCGPLFSNSSEITCFIYPHREVIFFKF